MNHFESQVALAKKRVRKMDAIDGYAERSPSTILAALEAGLRNPESGAQFDAFVMLKDVMEKERMKG